MKMKISGLTRRPLVMALLVGGGMTFVAINSYDVAPGEIARLILISVVFTLAIALPAALLVLAIKLFKHPRDKE